MVSILMNPWIVSTSEVQILKYIIVDLKTYLKVLYCFKSNSFVSRCIFKIHLFRFPSNLCFILPSFYRFTPFSVPRFINPIEQWILHEYHCHLEYNTKKNSGAYLPMHEGCLMKHSCVQRTLDAKIKQKTKKTRGPLATSLT